MKRACRGNQRLRVPPGGRRKWRAPTFGPQSRPVRTAAPGASLAAQARGGSRKGDQEGGEVVLSQVKPVPALPSRSHR